MNTFHALLDTKAKRELVFCLFAFGMIVIECFMNGLFLWRVIQIAKLEELYDLVSLARFGMIGRLVLSFFEASNMSFLSLLTSLFTHLSPRFIIIMMLSVYFLITKQSSRVFKMVKRLFILIVLIQFVVAILTISYVVVNIRYTTYGTVLRQLHWLSIFLFANQCLIGGLIFIAMIVSGYNLLQSMQYRAVEIMEEVSIEFDLVDEENREEHKKSSM